METFYKMVYHPEDKTMEGWYYLESETDKSVSVLNVQEKESSGPGWASGAVDYRLVVNKVTLPKSQIKLLEKHSTKENYFLFRIPYWLYKNNEGLEIKRIPLQKKFTMRDKDPLIEFLGIESYRKALMGLETDMNHIDRIIKNNS